MRPTCPDTNSITRTPIRFICNCIPNPTLTHQLRVLLLIPRPFSYVNLVQSRPEIALLCEVSAVFATPLLVPYYVRSFSSLVLHISSQSQCIACTPLAESFRLVMNMLIHSQFLPTASRGFLFFFPLFCSSAYSICLFSIRYAKLNLLHGASLVTKLAVTLAVFLSIALHN